MIVTEFVKDKWVTIAIILEICTAFVIIASFINAYVTPRNNNFAKI